MTGQVAHEHVAPRCQGVAQLTLCPCREIGVGIEHLWKRVLVDATVRSKRQLIFGEVSPKGEQFVG